jgi:undecaprenyl-diphosphatase
VHPTLRAAALAVAGTFPALVLGVAVRRGALAEADAWAARAAAVVDRRPALRRGLVRWQRAHHGRVVVPLGCLAALAVGGRRAPWAVTTMLGAWAAALAAKGLVRRPRPAGSRAPGSGYPSGHVAAGAAVACALTFVLVDAPGARRAAGAVLAADVAATAADRVLLRVHHLSDVVGGLAFGAGFVLGSARGAGRAHPLLSPSPKEPNHA